MGRIRNDDFVSINDRERDISGGYGKACLSRDLYRMATRSDFFRMMSIFYAGPGFFINNAVLMTTVYLQTWVLVVLALAGAYLISSGTLREAEGIGLQGEKDAEETPGEEPAPDESPDQNGRLLMEANRQILRRYHRFRVDTADDVPEDEPEEEPVDAAAELATGVDDQADDIYAQFYDPASLEDSGDGGVAYEKTTVIYPDGYADIYGDPDDEPEDEPEEEPVDAAAELATGVDDQADDIYTQFYDPASLEGSGDGGVAYEETTVIYPDDYADIYGDPYDEPASTATSSGQQVSSGPVTAGFVRQAAVHVHFGRKHMNSIVSM